MIKYSSRVFYFFIFLIFATIASAQELLQLGNYSYTRAPAPYLRTAISMKPGFFLKIGGVAFDTIAIGIDGLQVTELSYNASRDDGQRLIVVVQKPNGKEIQPVTNIYDWQLIPIANFANSEYGSAMTLFGSLDDEQFQEELLAEGGRAINYHPALDNTLVGLRIMQADIMMFDPNATDLPKNTKGYILGKGESAPDITRNRQHFDKIQKFLDEERSNGDTYQSYVIGDLGQKVEFYVKGKKLAFKGRLYWTMWDMPKEAREARKELDLVRSFYEGGDLGQRLLKNMYKTPQKLEQALLSDKAILGNWEKNQQIDKNPGLSDRVSARIEALDGINPVVYQTLKQVMNYGALFRHYKQKNPSGYASFLASLAAVSVEPKVTTPTVQRSTRLH